MSIKIFTIILIGMLLSVSSKQVFEQNLDIDSVFVTLEGPFEESEELVEGLKKSAIEYLFSNPSISQQFSKKGLGISERIGYGKESLMPIISWVLLSMKRVILQML